MINRDEISQAASLHGVSVVQIEKDYVLGWLLWALAQDADLGRSLVLKGGNCLRKAYFEDTLLR